MYLKKYNLKNKVALVTGAGKGLGKACAIALAEAGANLVIISRTQKDLNQVSKIIKKFKVKCKSYLCDVTDYDQIKSIIDKIPRIDVLINNAGTNFPEHFTKVKRSNMEYMVKINNVAAFNLAQLCTLKMLKTKNRKKIGGTGHTWHHSDETLHAIIKHGLAKLVKNYQGKMMGFGDKLSDKDIDNVLAYIKTYWNEEIYNYQLELSKNN